MDGFGPEMLYGLLQLCYDAFLGARLRFGAGPAVAPVLQELGRPLRA